MKDINTIACDMGKSFVILFLVLAVFGETFAAQAADVPIYPCQVVKAYPHDKSSFTQGLVFDNGVLFEGLGLLGHSALREVKLETGQVLREHKVDNKFFGEGITVYKDKIIQLTWRDHTGFVYDKNSFKLLREFSYSCEGWGITFNGAHLIISDGTPVLHFFDPETFQETEQVLVCDNKGPVLGLNELEYVKGWVYANVWKTERIAVINPQTGRVEGWIDLKGIWGSQGIKANMDVLNGIAYDAQNDRLFITGKLWPKLFEIKLIISK